MIGSVTKKEVN